MKSRRGFALIVVLSVLASISIMSLASTASIRVRVDEASSRAAELRAQWRVEGCASSLAASLDRIAAATTGVPGGATASWVRLDSLVLSAGASDAVGFTGCSVRLEPAGIGLNVNAVSEHQFRAYLTACGVEPSLADTVAASVLDWIDADSVPRRAGAERADYRHVARPGPRNGKIAHVSELLLVYGFDQLTSVLQNTVLAGLSTESGRLLVGRADRRALASLAGMTMNGAAALSSIEVPRTGSFDLGSVTGSLVREERDSVTQHYSELLQALTGTPDAWIVTITASDGSPRIAESLTLRLSRTGGGIATSFVRRRLL